mgnify:CR=1 FL=1
MSILRWLTPFLFVCSLLALPFAAHSQVDDGQAKTLLRALADAPESGKVEALAKLVTSGDERTRGWLEAFGNNKLSVIEDTGQMVIVLKNRGRNWTVADALTGETIGEVSRRDLDSVRINNSLRGTLKGMLSVIDLTVDDPERRLEAARNMRGNVDDALVERLRPLMEDESRPAIKQALREALAIHRVEQGDVSEEAESQEADAAMQALRSEVEALRASLEDSGQGGEGEAGAGAVEVYAALVEQTVKSQWRYAALGSTEALRARVVLRINSQGDITEIQLRDRSGNETFDRSVLRAVEDTGTLPSPPNDKARQVSITFNLQAKE